MNLPKNGVAKEIRHYAGSLLIFLFVIGNWFVSLQTSEKRKLREYVPPFTWR